MKPELQAYKALVKATVRADRAARVAQRVADRKQQLALLTYRRMNIAREQGKRDIDSATKVKLLKEMSVLNMRVELLKRSDPQGDKSLLFVRGTQFLRDQIANAPAKRHIQHLRDVAAFVNNQREYDELIERYNPGSKLSQEEHVKLTANRVGFNMPQER